MKKIILFVPAFLCSIILCAQINTWTGPSTGSWNTAANWSLAAVPVAANEIVFDGSLTPSVTIADCPFSTPFFKKLTVKNNATVNLSATSNTVMGLDNGLFVEAGSRLIIGGTTATKFVIQGATSTAASSIAGILELKGTGNSLNFTGFDPYFTFGTTPVTTVTGRIVISGPNAKISNSNSSNLLFENGSLLEFQRDGGQTPAANYKNGSRILIAGVVASVTGFTSSALYNGVIEWNAPNQTTAGSAATLGLSSSYTMDSFLVKNTGALGTVRFTTELSSAPNINWVRVEGGNLEFASPRANYRTITIGSNLEVAGGTCFINAADGTDGALNYAVTATINGNLLVSGGTLNLCNRTSGTTVADGAGQLLVKGDLIQTGGLITETSNSTSSLYPNLLHVSGTNLQQVSLSNWTNQVALYFSNKTNGASLQNTITCPYKLQLNDSSFTFLNQQHLIANNSDFSFLGYGRLVTNGTGHLRLTNVAVGATTAFPVTPGVQSISTLQLQNNGVTNAFDVRVERGIHPAGIFNTGLTVNRTWIINDATTGPNNSVGLRFSYPDTVLNGGPATRTTNKELGHFISPAWNVDPNGITQLPVTGGASPATDQAGFFAPIGLDSAFVLGEEGAILALDQLAVHYFKGSKQGSRHLLQWQLQTSVPTRLQTTLERSNNGSVGFTPLFQQSLANVSGNSTGSFTDEQPLLGYNFYRLKITDGAGQISYSKTIQLFADAKFTLAPNLVTQQSMLTIQSATAGNMQLVFTDAIGRVVRKQRVLLGAGSNTVIINGNNLSKGIYQITGFNSNGNVVGITQMIKQ